MSDIKGYFASSKAGHDKGTVYMILESDDVYVYLSDGKLRPTDTAVFTGDHDLSGSESGESGVQCERTCGKRIGLHFRCKECIQYVLGKLRDRRTGIRRRNGYGFRHGKGIERSGQCEISIAGGMRFSEYHGDQHGYDGFRISGGIL